MSILTQARDSNVVQFYNLTQQKSVPFKVAPDDNNLISLEDERSRLRGNAGLETEGETIESDKDGKSHSSSSTSPASAGGTAFDTSGETGKPANPKPLAQALDLDLSDIWEGALNRAFVVKLYKKLRGSTPQRKWAEMHGASAGLLGRIEAGLVPMERCIEVLEKDYGYSFTLPTIEK